MFFIYLVVQLDLVLHPLLVVLMVQLVQLDLDVLLHRWNLVDHVLHPLQLGLVYLWVLEVPVPLLLHSDL